MDGPDEYRHRDAAELAGVLGRHAVGLVPRLTQMITVDDSSGWTQACAAVSLWRITGQARPTVSVLLEAAARNPVTLDIAVPCWAEIGPDAGEALPLLRRELAGSARHFGRDFGVNPVAGDIAYVTRCRDALSKLIG